MFVSLWRKQALEALAPFPPCRLSLFHPCAVFTVLQFSCLSACFYCWKQKADFQRLWATAFPFNISMFFYSHAPVRPLVARVMRGQDPQIPFITIRKAFSRLIAWATVIPHFMCGGLLLNSHSAQYQCGWVHWQADHRMPRHAPLPFAANQTQAEQGHKDPRSRMWRSGTHTVKTGI